MIPTATINAALAQLDEHGYAIVENALDPAAVGDVRERLFRAADRSEQVGVPTTGYAFDPDRYNRRVFHLFNLDPVFVELIGRPDALAFVQHVLGETYLISNFSANITRCGNAPMQLHADQGYVPAPWPAQPLAVNVAWLLDDFTAENGGTRYVPGSHLRGHGPDPSVATATVPITAPAGSLLVMDGRLWHQTGENRTPGVERAALFGYYVARWLRPQINWNVVLWPEVAATLDPAFLDRLGYYTGNVEGLVPAGDRAAIRVPAAIEAAGGAPFPLASGAEA